MTKYYKITYINNSDRIVPGQQPHKTVLIRGKNKYEAHLNFHEGNTFFNRVDKNTYPMVWSIEEHNHPR